MHGFQVGNVCLGMVPKADRVNVLFTNKFDSGRQSFFKQCPNAYHIKENVCGEPPSLQVTVVVKRLVWEDYGHNVEGDVFKRAKDDEKLALSVEDLTFFSISKEGFYQN